MPKTPKTPKPFTPPDCDLRGLPYMPLLGERLIESDLFFKSTGDEFKAALALWWASWKQVPAASLPDDSRVLAGLARVGDARKWAKVKAGALHGWTKCSDGRLYHRTVADLALEAWEDRQDHRANRESEAERKRREREERKAIFAALKKVGVHLPWNTTLAELRRAAEGNAAKTVTNLSAGQAADVPDIEVEVEGTIERTPIPLAGVEPRSEIFEQAWSAYHAASPSNRGKGDARAAWQVAVPAAGGEGPLLAAVLAHVERLAKSPRQTAKAFHRWLRDGGFEAYLDRSPPAATWPGPPEVWSAIVAARGEGFARSYLLDCAWQDVPCRGLINSSPTALAKLRQEVGPLLRDMGIELQDRAA
jgi:hypothetical protein